MKTHIFTHTHTHTHTQNKKKQKTQQKQKKKNLGLKYFSSFMFGVITMPQTLKSSNFPLNILEKKNKYVMLLSSQLNSNESLCFLKYSIV